MSDSEKSENEAPKEEYIIPDGVKQHYRFKAYGADNKGIIYSLKYDRTIKKHVDKQGYEYVCVRLEGKTHNLRVNIFVYECFNGEFEDDKIIDHIDNNKLNNSIENLQCITQSENIRKKYENGQRYNTKSRPVTAIDKDGKRKDYKSIYAASKDVDVVCASIARCCLGIQQSATSKTNKEKYSFEFFKKV